MFDGMHAPARARVHRARLGRASGDDGAEAVAAASELEAPIFAGGELFISSVMIPGGVMQLGSFFPAFSREVAALRANGEQSASQPLPASFRSFGTARKILPNRTGQDTVAEARSRPFLSLSPASSDTDRTGALWTAAPAASARKLSPRENGKPSMASRFA